MYGNIFGQNSTNWFVLYILLFKVQSAVRIDSLKGEN